MSRRTVAAILAELRAIPGVYHAYVTGGKGGYDIILDDRSELHAPTYREALQMLKTVTPVIDRPVKTP